MADETNQPDMAEPVTEIESPMPPPEADPKDAQIAALTEEAAALKDRMLRLAADMENLRKRAEREKAEATLYAATNFARDLLSVTDNMGRALATVSPEERERADDVIEIAETALSRFAEEEGRHFDGLSPDVRGLFRRLPWPGNVRQLLNVIRNVVVLNDGGLVTKSMLPDDLAQSEGTSALPSAAKPLTTEPNLDGLIGKTMAEIEQTIIEATLARHGGSVPKAARILDISPSTLYRKLESWAKT